MNISTEPSVELSNDSKPDVIIKKYLNEAGESSLIVRHTLPSGLAWTSGDGIFRNDGTLGKKYKFFRFAPLLNFSNQHSCCWEMTDEDEARVKVIHSSLTFPKKDDPMYKGAGTTVYYIQFFGTVKDDEVIDKGIHSAIRKEICKGRCAHCGTTKDIQCDHKNDLKNDLLVVTDLNNQTLADFQPLCRRCNIMKARAKAVMLKTGKRYSALELGYNIGFTSGDETLDQADPHWYIGTYWGDCAAFKKKLYLQASLAADSSYAN